MPIDPGPLKNPGRVHPLLQQADAIGEASGTGPSVTFVKPAEAVIEELPGPMSIKSQNGQYTVQADGLYKNPDTGDQFQFRKGQVVGENAANFKRIGGWPGEPDEAAVEEAATAGAKQAEAPENKAAPAPEAKNK